MRVRASVGHPSLLFVLVELGIRPRSIGKLAVERLAIPDAAAQKLGPGRDCNILRNWFGKKTPKLWVMPAQIVPTTVAVSADAVPQSHHLGNQFFPGLV